MTRKWVTSDALRYVDLRIGLPGAPGAACDGVTDDTNAINNIIAAISAAGGGTLVPPKTGSCRTSAAIIIKQGVRFESPRRYFTINCTNGAADGIRVEAPGSGSVYGRWSIKHIEIAGTFDTGVVCAHSPLSNTGGLHGEMDTVLVSGTGNNGFRFANVYYSAFRNLSCDSAVLSNACFQILAAVNGVAFDNLQTGGTAGHLYCIYIAHTEQPPGASGLSAGHGVTLNSPVMQGGKYGLYVASCRSLVVNNPYFEQVANPVVIGGPSSGIIARTVVINGGTYGVAGPTATYYADRGPVFRITNARGVTITSPELFVPAHTLPCPITGGAGSNGWVSMLINRDGTPAAYVIAHCGRGYTSVPTVTAPTPVSGTADTLTVTLTSQRITGLTVTPGSSPVYATGDAYPVAVMYGERVGRVVFLNPIHGISGDNIPFHAFIGRDSTALATNGITVLGDFGIDNQDLETRKTEGAGNLHAHAFFDAAGARVVYTRAIPLIASP